MKMKNFWIFVVELEENFIHPLKMTKVIERHYRYGSVKQSSFSEKLMLDVILTDLRSVEVRNPHTRAAYRNQLVPHRSHSMSITAFLCVSLPVCLIRSAPRARLRLLPLCPFSSDIWRLIVLLNSLSRYPPGVWRRMASDCWLPDASSVCYL